MLVVLAAVLCLLVQIVATEPHLRVLHRLYSPSEGSFPWSDRGTLFFQDGQLEWTASNTFQQDLLSFRKYQKEKGEVGVLYQVGLEREGDIDERQWCLSSVKACYLTESTSETLALQLDHKGVAFGLDYFVDPIPHDGSCLNIEKSSSTKIDEYRSLNSTVLMVRPARPPSPELLVPPRMSSEGEPIQLQPEKSFFQKYWMYILAFVLVTLLAPGPEEPQSEDGEKK